MSKTIDLINNLLSAIPTGNETQPRRRAIKAAPIKPVYVPPTITQESARAYLEAMTNAGKRQVMQRDPETNQLVPKFYTQGHLAGKPVMETDSNFIRQDQAKAVIAFLGEKAYKPSNHAASVMRANTDARIALSNAPAPTEAYSRGTAAVANGFTPGMPIQGERERRDMIAKRDLLIGYALDAEKKGDTAKAEAFRKGADMLTQELDNK